MNKWTKVLGVVAATAVSAADVVVLCVSLLGSPVSNGRGFLFLEQRTFEEIQSRLGSGKVALNLLRG